MLPDSFTLKAIGGDILLDHLEISTSYGRNCLSETDCLTWTHDQCTQHYQRIKVMLDFFQHQPQRYATLKAWLSGIENIDPILINLKTPDYSLMLEEIFILKKHLYLTRKILHDIQDTPIAPFFSADPLQTVWSLLDSENLNTPSFGFSTLYYPELETAREAYREIMRRQTLLTQELRHQISRENGLSVVPERLSLSNQTQSLLIDHLLESGNFYILEKNYYNTILQIQTGNLFLSLEKEKAEIISHIKSLEESILADLTLTIQSYHQQLKSNTQAIGKLDFDLARIHYAIQYSCIIPEITDTHIEIKQGRLIFFQQQLEQKKMRYLPLDIDTTDTINIITGMNMGGKSIVLKTLGFLVFHLQLALPVPALEARLPLFKTLFYSGSENKDAFSGLSTFGAEVVRFNEAPDDTGSRLYLLDEFASSTNPVEGAAINTGILNYFAHDTYTWCFLCTHLDLKQTHYPWAFWQMAGLSRHQSAFWQQVRCISLSKRLFILHELMDYRLLRLNTHQPPPRQALAVAEALGFDPLIMKEIKAQIPYSEVDDPQHIKKNDQECQGCHISDTENPQSAKPER